MEVVLPHAHKGTYLHAYRNLHFNELGLKIHIQLTEDLTYFGVAWTRIFSAKLLGSHFHAKKGKKGALVAEMQIPPK